MTLDERFKELADEWEAHRQSVLLSSNIHHTLNHPAYRALIELGPPALPLIIERYRTDAAMRQCTDTVARGLHLAVLGFTPQGIVLGADEDGPFVHKLSDYRRGGLSVEDRMCHGLVQLAIAAWCFPTAQDLAASDDSAGVRFSTNKVVAYVVLRPGASLDRAALDAHLRECLAPYKRPHRVQVMDSLPMTQSGKVLKRRLVPQR